MAHEDGTDAAPDVVPPRMTQVEYAAHIGKTKQYVGKLKTAGTVVMVEVDGRELVDVAASDKNRARDSHPGRTTNGGAAVDAAPSEESGGPSYVDAKTRKAKAEADLRELDLAARRGELIERAAINAAIEEIMATVAGGLERVVPLIADRVLSLTDPNQTRAAVEEELRKVQTAMADEFNQRAAHVIAGGN